MRILLILTSYLIVATASQDSDDAFQGFVQQYKKHYSNRADQELRREVFMNNWKKIEEHNKMYSEGKVTWFMKIHEDMDLTVEEWMDKRVKGLPASNTTGLTKSSPATFDMSAEDQYPKGYFSWVDQGAVSSVKDQGACGSCAAFATMAAIESCYFLATGVLPNDLSEQFILDCAHGHSYWDEHGVWTASGCEGAWHQAYLDFAIFVTSLQEEWGYPYSSGYTGSVGACNPSGDGIYRTAHVTGMNNMYYSDETNMLNVLPAGPIILPIQVSDSWFYYGGGVLETADCCSQAYTYDCEMYLNHAVLVVGYGNEGGVDYWLIKNSYGAGWGEGGFLKLRMGIGHCGIGTMVQTQVACALQA